MYLISVEIKDSPINGKGVFATQKIGKGDIVWKFNPKHEETLSTEEFEKLDDVGKGNLKRVAYLSAVSKRYVYPPEGDPARFTNHDAHNNLSVLTNVEVSEEPYFVANRDIGVGEELTNNYVEFDESLKRVKPDWI